MTTAPVRFEFHTGLRRFPFTNVRLVGNWNPLGFPTRKEWAQHFMQAGTAPDGCPMFTALVGLDPGSVGQQFSWFLLGDTPERKDVPLVYAEVPDLATTERVRRLLLQSPRSDGQPQVEIWRYTQGRRLGAHKYHAVPGAPPRLRFGVWAPNATKVQVVFGHLFDAADPKRHPLTEPHPLGRIAGGYIADDGNGIGPATPVIKLERHEGGVWLSNPDEPALRDFAALLWRPYMLHVTRDDGAVVFRTDVCSRQQLGLGLINPQGAAYPGRVVDLDGSVSCSVVIDPDIEPKELYDPNLYDAPWPPTYTSDAEFWSDEFRPDRPVPRRVEDLVIYELHVGSLGAHHPGPGSFLDALELLPYLEDLGINCVEVLPVAESGGNAAAWGYSTSHYYAIENSLGGVGAFKRFVRECHRRGIAVLVDVVYNHYIHDANRVQWFFDTADPTKNVYYWYEGTPTDYPGFQASVEAGRKPNGGYLDNVSSGWAPRYHEEQVRQLFIGSALALLDECHIDGFRVDQTTCIHSYNSRHADGASVPHANQWGAKFLREWTRALKIVKPDVILTAEDHSNWDKVTSTEDDGMGFDAVWYADYYHHLIGDTDKGADYAKLLKIAGHDDKVPLRLDYFVGALQGTGQKRIAYHSSHDEMGNGQHTDRTLNVAVNGAPLVGPTREFAEARVRLVSGITFFAAGTPMFFFGDEVGSTLKFLYDAGLDNREDLVALRHGTGQHLFAFYQAAIRLRLASPGLRSRALDVVHANNETRVLAYRRWAEQEEFLVVASFNNAPAKEPYAIASERLAAGVWREVLNSDDVRFGGRGLLNPEPLVCAEGKLALRFGADAVVVLRRA